MKITQFLLPIAAAGCLAFAAISIANTTPKREITDPPQDPPRSEFKNTVAATGLVEPNTEIIAIGTPLSGIVESVEVAAGDTIKKGQLLFVTDTRQLLAQRDIAVSKIAQTQALAETAKVRVEQAARRLKTAQSLRDSRAMADEEAADRASENTRLVAELSSAQAAIQVAEAELKSVATEIERSRILSPIDGTVLQIRVRQGEFISGSETTPRLLLGNITPLHVRVDIDEFEIPRVRAGAVAKASPRGNATLSYSLEFVRFEPYVIPKRALTGESTERVDTRSLQAIYRVSANPSDIFVGQQLEVFIDAPARKNNF
jgi:HlyD family secretion protein